MERHKVEQIQKGDDPNDFNDKKKQEYTEKFGSIVCKGFVALGIAIGHKVGLFKALRESKVPLTSQELADKGGWRERYVREWLGSMVAAELVFMTEDDKYCLPSDVDTNGLEILCLLLPASAKRIDDVYNCFQSDGEPGFTYDKQHDVIMMFDEEKQQHSTANTWLDENLIPSDMKCDEVKDILDIGCGSGRVTINLAKRFPKAVVIGIDNDLAIEMANKVKKEENIANVKFEKVGVENMTWKNKFDWIVALDVLHDLPNPKKSLACIKTGLKDNGLFSAFDPAAHSHHRDNRGLEQAAAFLTVSCCICLPSSLSSGEAAGHGVGWGLENRAQFITDNGFEIKGKKTEALVHCKKAK